jgi:hypothetical protein
MFALIIMSVVAIAAFRTAEDEHDSALSFREATRAQYAAEAGLRNTLGQWPTKSMANLPPGGTLDLGWKTLPDRSTYHSVIYRVDQGGVLQAYEVVTQSRLAGRRAASSAVTQMVFGAPPMFNFGIFTQGNMVMSGGTATDGYNSASGPYNSKSADSTGSVGANGSISLSGGSKVLGNATAAGTISASGSTITGTVSAKAVPFPLQPILDCPKSGYTPAGELPIVSGLKYSATTGDLTASGGTSVILTKKQYYFHSVILSGGSTLTMDVGGEHADLWIDDKLDVSGGGIVNTGSLPTGLGIWSCGAASTSQWTLSGGSGAYFSVYAPNHPVVLSGGGDMFGAIVGASFVASGGSGIHFDEALANRSSVTLKTDSRTWALFP